MQTAHPLPQSGTVSNSRTTRRRFPRWALIVLALLIIAAGVAWYFQSRATPAATTTVPLTRGDLTLSVNGNGAVAPAASVDLPFQVAGQVTAVKVAVRDAVKAGQPLATLDTRDLQNQVAAAQAAVQSAQANLDQLQHGGATPQDLANARALVTKPALLLADEPTGNLDSHASEEIMALFEELNHQGITVVLVTHEPDVAAHAQRLLTIKDELLAGDTTEHHVTWAAPRALPAMPQTNGRAALAQHWQIHLSGALR